MILSDATIWKIAQESSIMLLEAPFTILEDIYSTGHSGYDCKITIVACSILQAIELHRSIEQHVIDTY
jgi:hypothetical protein